MDLFLLKKIISLMIMPLSITIILLLFAVIFYRIKPKLSFVALLSGSSLLLFSTLPPISDTLMAPLENNYPAFTRSVKPVDYIVILGGAHTTVAGLPATSQLNSSSLARLVEALRIYNMYPEAQIITSGFSGGDVSSNAEKVKQAAVSLGVPAHRIITENFPQDTQEEAQLISPRVINSNVVLVTSANHMPRAMAYFEKNGVYAIPAPASPWVKHNEHRPWQYYFPSGKKLQQTSVAWYEVLGRVVQWFKSL